MRRGREWRALPRHKGGITDEESHVSTNCRCGSFLWGGRHDALVVKLLDLLESRQRLSEPPRGPKMTKVH
jgi:hypothetical protein